MTKLYIHVIANVVLSSWCYYLKNKSNVLALVLTVIMLGERDISYGITYKCRVLFLVIKHNILDACVLALVV